ncbi:MAG: hemerythrin domain-containing protein [Prevotellaceae bacterium]|nr:hemerythrin domain-containing protein [Prevotellaceae bacterium]
MTEKYHESDPMSDVISDDYRILQIISRFGIRLGFGDQTVGATCRAAGVDAGTFLTVVNYVKDAAHAHISEMAEQINLSALITYLKNSHNYFVDFRLPGIRRKLLQALDLTAGNRIPMLILRFYDEYAQEVERHMTFENTHVHPYVETLLQGKLPADSFSKIEEQYDDQHASIEKSLSELKSIIVKYYPSDNNAQLMGEVLMDIFMTEEDLLSHCHMEDTLFAECVRRLEHEVRSQGGKVIQEELEEKTDSAKTGDLSDREKEIIVQVVKGLSNKEIAETLFISVNTVMTHRRNISRKLQIRSASGLTIYAIVNGLVNLDDIQL